MQKKDYPWLAGAVLTGGVIAPILLMVGLTMVSGFSASLLLNLEGIATALIAVLFFKENANQRLWIALLCMTIGAAVLTWDSSQGAFNALGPALIVLAMAAWGVDNNLTRQISDHDPVQIARIKGLSAGAVSLSIAFALGASLPSPSIVGMALALGAFSYGLSLVLFIKALQGMGSFRTGVFFGFGPFIGALASLLLLKEVLNPLVWPAAALMAVGLWLIMGETHSHRHVHRGTEHEHPHWPDTEHRHAH